MNAYGHKPVAGAGAALMHSFVEYELAFCRYTNRASDRPVLRRFFSVVSRLGDGVYWYTLIVLIPLFFGTEAIRASIHMALAGFTGVVVYKFIKQGTRRARPYAVSDQIRPGCAALDRYSFPSGHTLHAVGFSMVAIAYDPQLAWVTVPMAILVAASRVMLGLHFPTDVFAGAVIGAAIAGSSLLLFPA